MGCYPLSSVSSAGVPRCGLTVVLYNRSLFESGRLRLSSHSSILGLILSLDLLRNKSNILTNTVSRL